MEKTTPTMATTMTPTMAPSMAPNAHKDIPGNPSTAKSSVEKLNDALMVNH
jgi:hypothetical protein